MNAIDLLKEDHDVVSALFEKVRDKPESSHRAIFKKIKAELEVHTHIEETVFYPRLKKDGKKELVDITLEGIEEHRQVKTLLREMAGMRGRRDEFEAKLQVLMENVDHHVDEEEDEMFPLVEDQFSDEQLERLGRSIENKKLKYLEANPEAAKNLANRNALRKSGMLGVLYKTAAAVVGGLVGGGGETDKPRKGSTANGKAANRKSKARTANGKRTAANSRKNLNKGKEQGRQPDVIGGPGKISSI